MGARWEAAGGHKRFSSLDSEDDLDVISEANERLAKAWSDDIKEDAGDATIIQLRAKDGHSVIVHPTSYEDHKGEYQISFIPPDGIPSGHEWVKTRDAAIDSVAGIGRFPVGRPGRFEVVGLRGRKGKVNPMKKKNPRGIPRLKIGDRVEVSGGGVNSGKTGVIVKPHFIPTNGRGIPQVGQGHYKPVDWKREVAIRYDGGKLDTMFKSHLKRIGLNPFWPTGTLIKKPRRNPKARGTKNFTEKRLSRISVKRIHPKSFRLKRVGKKGTLIRFGCPRNKWAKGKCKGGMVALAALKRRCKPCEVKAKKIEKKLFKRSRR